jgi:hypothetical protein
MFGTSHHMDPVKCSLNLYISVKTITSFSDMDVQHHTSNCICSPCYGCFSLHLTHMSCFVQTFFSTGIKIIRKYSVHSSVTFLRNSRSLRQYRIYLFFMVPKTCIMRSFITCNLSQARLKLLCEGLDGQLIQQAWGRRVMHIGFW